MATNCDFSSSYQPFHLFLDHVHYDDYELYYPKDREVPSGLPFRARLAPYNFLALCDFKTLQPTSGHDPSIEGYPFAFWEGSHPTQQFGYVEPFPLATHEGSD